MALVVNMQKDKLVVILAGCVGKKSCGDKCDKMQQYVEYVDLNINKPSLAVSSLMRLFLHTIFGRLYRIDQILKKYEDIVNIMEITNPNLNHTDGLRIMKSLILEDLKSDADWKVCQKCEQEYDSGIRPFQRVLYTVPSIKTCNEHL